MIIVWIVLLFFILIIIYSIKPNIKRLKELPVQLFAHRGLHTEGIPENSISAFEKAREKGFGVELDVRYTKDKKLVVFHDDDLTRLCNVDKKVKELNYDELRNCFLLGTNETIPLFSEVLKVLDGVPIICEIKSFPDEPVDDICKDVSHVLDSYKGFSCIESFNPFVVRWFRKNRQDFIRGQLSMNFLGKHKALKFSYAFLMSHLLVNFISRPDFIAYRFTDDSIGFYLCRKVYNPVCVAWTIKSDDDRNLVASRYSAFIFEEECY